MYNVCRTLVINSAEAETVRLIFVLS